VIMAAIPAVVHFISASLIGVSVPILGYIGSALHAALSAAILSYVLALVGIFIVTLIVDALAPTFGGQKNQVQALKTVAMVYRKLGCIDHRHHSRLTLIAALAGGITASTY